MNPHFGSNRGPRQCSLPCLLNSATGVMGGYVDVMALTGIAGVWMGFDETLGI
jgi:hypothetical protein